MADNPEPSDDAGLNDIHCATAITFKDKVD